MKHGNVPDTGVSVTGSQHVGCPVIMLVNTSHTDPAGLAASSETTGGKVSPANG